MHALKFQAFAAPNGLTANFFGPIEGRRHDSALLVMPELLRQLEERSFSPNRNALCLYVDPAYPHRVPLQRPFAKGPGITPDEGAFTQSISRVRGQLSGYLVKLLTTLSLQI